MQTLDGDLLVAPEVAQALGEAAVTGLELRPAVSARDRSPLPWRQLLAAVELPPMAPQTRGVVRENPCPHCRRDGFFHTARVPFEPVYSATEVAVDRLPDAVHTYERFGNSILRQPFHESRFAGPLLLVKPKVLEVFRRLKVRGVGFVPVTVN